MASLKVILLLSIIAHMATGKSCSNQYRWRWYESRYGTSCYMPVARHLNWFEAASFCNTAGGHLVAIDSAQENTYLVQFIRNDYRMRGHDIWTSGNDLAGEGTWMWGVGVNKAVTYTNWYYRQPSGGSEHCLELIKKWQFKWNDDQCENKKYFICEY